MKIDIEDIKALEPGKVYVMEIDTSTEDANEAIAMVRDFAKENDLTFLFLAKGYAKIISVPEGIEINTEGFDAFQLMEKEMIAYLKKTYPIDDPPPTPLLVTELVRIFRANKDPGPIHCVTFLNSNKWPKEVTEEQLWSIIQKWRANLPESKEEI